MTPRKAPGWWLTQRLQHSRPDGDVVPRQLGGGGAAMSDSPLSRWMSRHGDQSVGPVDLAGPPALVEERRKRAVQPQEGEPALAGHALDPVALAHSDGSLGSDRDRGRPVRVGCG